MFNPNVQAGQDNSPNYFKFSEPISQPKADTSTGQFLDTIGKGIDSATTLADQTTKDVINKDVHDTVDTTRDAFTKQLENKVGVQQSNIVPAPVQTAAGSTTGSLLDSNASMDAPVPAAIDAGLGKVDAIQSAMASGKINDTYYTQRLNAAAVDLRTKYPGYRDYIDQRIAQTTGFDPANKYVQNLVQDANAQAVKKDTEFDKTETMLRGALQDHVPNADIMLQYFRANKGNPDAQNRAEQFIYSSQSEKAAIDLANARRTNNQGNLADIKTQRTQDFVNEVGTSIASNFSAMTTIPGTDTPQGIQDFVKAVAAHPEQYSSAQLRTLDSQIMAQKAVLQSQYLSKAAQTQRDAQGRTFSYNSDIGTDTVKNTLNDLLGSYDTIHNALTGGGPEGAGLAYLAMNQVKARFGDRENSLSMGPLGQTVDTFKILNNDLGPAFAGVLAPKLINSPAMGSLTDLLNKSSLDARAQPDFDKSGKPLTYMDHVAVTNKMEADGKINAAMKARYQAGLIKIGQDIQDPDMPDVTKAKVVKYLFSPEGQGLLGTFKTDYTNSEGKLVPGKYAVFNALTSQGMVDNITKLARTDPTIGTMYKNYLENEAGSQLFYKEFQNMNRITGHDDLHFKYNDGANTTDGMPKVSLIDRDGKDIQPPKVVPGQWGTGNNNSPTYTAGLLEQVNHINQALTGMGRVEKGLGGDVNSYVLNVLQHAQVNLGQNWTGLPQKLADAIAASRSPQKRIDEVFGGIK